MSRGTNIQFGGGLGQQAGASVGEGVIFGYPTNTIFLDPGLASEGAEIIAANVAHEAYHIESQMTAAGHGVILRSHFSKTEEMHAFAQEARAWEGLRVTYRGSNAWWYDTILSQYRAGNLKDFVGSQAIYMQWFYQFSQ